MEASVCVSSRMKAQKVNRILKGKHPKTLLEVFSEEDDMPKVGKKHYPYTKKGKADAAAAAKKGSKKK